MSVIVKETERHTIDKALNSREGENILHQITSFVSAIPESVLILLGVCVVIIVIAYVLTGKERGSHAGREGVRRAYRRELAKQMARQDAEKIKSGQKERKRWMQW